MNENSVKYCLYARKSSEQDERQAMSIESQVKEMRALAERDDLMVVDIKRESHSAKLSAARPVFLEVLKDIRDEKYNGILTWAPDRLSRNAGDLGSLVDLMDSNKLMQIRTYSQSFGNNPNEKFLLMILCSQAKLENDNRAVNVKRGIRAKCEMGWRPCMPPLGYYTRAATGGARDVIVDEHRAPYIKKMFELSAEGRSGRYIFNWLDKEGIRSRTNKLIHLSTIYSILKNPFYYGEFEYPLGSNQWYKGNHQPIIDKVIFNKVQAQLEVPQKSKWGAKEFPFKGVIKCGGCGSSVVGEEKFKRLAGGCMNRHVYYHCSRQTDHNCKEPFIRELALIEELIQISDKLEICDFAEKGLLKALNQFTSISRSLNPKLTDKSSTTAYIRYIFLEGSLFEKTRLTRNLKNNLKLLNRQILLS